jgi:small conductance mechanosensitive channel
VAAAVGVVLLAIPVAHAIAKVVRGALARVPNMPDEVVRDSGRFSKGFVYLIAVGLALRLLGLGAGWMTLLVVLALVIGVLMLRPMIENSAAGLLLTLRPAFAVGDQIETGEYRGTVTQIGSRSTVLQTSQGLRIHIPNTQVLGGPIVVYTASDSRKAQFDVSLAHGTDLDQVTELIMGVIPDVDGVQEDPAPAVQASGFQNDTVTLSVSYWYSSSMTSDSSVTDGVIRATEKALVGAGVTLAVQSLDVTAEAPGSS